MQKFLAFLPFTLANLDRIQKTLKEVEEFQSTNGSRSLTSLNSVSSLNNYRLNIKFSKKLQNFSVFSSFYFPAYFLTDAGATAECWHIEK